MYSPVLVRSILFCEAPISSKHPRYRIDDNCTEQGKCWKIYLHLYKVRTVVKLYSPAFCFSRSHFCRLLAPRQQHPLFYRLLFSASIRVLPLVCSVTYSINHTLARDIRRLFSLEVIVLGIDRAYQRITQNFTKNKLSFITSLWSK